MAGLVIDIYIGFVVRWAVILWREAQSHQWPIVTGTVAHCSFEECGFAGDYVELRYEYGVDSEAQSGILKKPYIYPNYAQAFVRHYPAGVELKIRVHPQLPAQSFPVLD